MLASLAAIHPNVRIEVVTLRPTTDELFSQLNRFVAATIFLPLWTKGRVAFAVALLRVMLTKRYDVSFLAYPAGRWEYQLVHALIRSKRRFSHRYARDFPLDTIGIFAVTRIANAGRSNVTRNADLFRSAGYEVELGSGYELPQAWGEPGASSERYTVLHVGSVNHDTFAAKRWPLENFVALGRRLIAGGERVIFLGGPDERIETREAVGRTEGSQLFEGSLAETARLLRSAALVITNDSGIGHLTAGLRRPVISLFGPTSLEHAPYGDTAVPLRPSACPPCFDILSGDMTCKLNIDYACLRRDLPVEFVEREALRVLGTPA